VLIIRREQMQALASGRQGPFTERLLRQVASIYPRRYAELGEAGTRRLIARVVENGVRHGIHGELALARLVGLVLVFGETFELSPDPVWAREVLTHPTLPGSIKVDVLSERFIALAQGRTVSST
jgi:hypothetical protein